MLHPSLRGRSTAQLGSVCPLVGEKPKMAHKPSASHPQLRRKPAIGLLILMRRPRFSCRCERRDDHELRRPVGHRLVGAEARLEIDQVHRFEITPLRKSMARTMHLEIYSMRVAEAPKRRRLVDAESFARGL